MLADITFFMNLCRDHFDLFLHYVNVALHGALALKVCVFQGLHQSCIPSTPYPVSPKDKSPRGNVKKGLPIEVLRKDHIFYSSLHRLCN